MSHFAVSGRVDVLTDGTVGSVDAAMGAAIGPYWKFRFNWRIQVDMQGHSAEGECHEALYDHQPSLDQPKQARQRK